MFRSLCSLLDSPENSNSLHKPTATLPPVDLTHRNPPTKSGFESFMIQLTRLFNCFLLPSLMGLCISTTVQAQTPQPVEPGKSHYQSNVYPFVNKFCSDCHSGDEAEAGIDFGKFSESSNIQEKYDTWETIRRIIAEGQMPPPDVDQPSPDEVVKILDAIDLELASFDCTSVRHPGLVTIRRLNRAEYDNTIRDLLGLELDLSQDFPTDDVGAGFDNIGDVLTLPPILFEKYLDAAERVADAAFANEQARQRILKYTPNNESERVEVVRKNVEQFAERAYRRPLAPAEKDRLFAIMAAAWDQNLSVEEIFKTVVAAILTNPNFLYRIEADPEELPEDGIRPLNSFELASRMSYFIWSSMPDDELFAVARSGELLNREIRNAQVQRMLADPKAQALVDNFAGQWLQLRDVARLTPDNELFPGFDAELRAAMQLETETFFLHLMQQNRSLLDFLNADYTFVNERLARHYGMTDIQGPDFRQVPLPEGRRGVLTHASILMLTSNPTRTSPVKRGKWILENILAEPPPPAPPNVPELEEGVETLGSLREQMEQHRANPSCSVCHRTMDALGFGLENFDPIGGWRDRDGRFDIDASGELPGGRKFDGAGELMLILSEEKKQEFCRCIIKKMLTFAIGRGLESYDRCAVNEILSALEQNEYRFGTLVAEIISSEPFMLREARRTE